MVTFLPAADLRQEVQESNQVGHLPSSNPVAPQVSHPKLAQGTEAPKPRSLNQVMRIPCQNSRAVLEIPIQQPDPRMDLSRLGFLDSLPGDR